MLEKYSYLFGCDVLSPMLYQFSLLIVGSANFENVCEVGVFIPRPKNLFENLSEYISEQVCS